MPDQDDTGALKARQIENLRHERALAREAADEEEHAQHARRAEKADYLREKLEERERSEEAARGQDPGRAERAHTGPRERHRRRPGRHPPRPPSRSERRPAPNAVRSNQPPRSILRSCPSSGSPSHISASRETVRSPIWALSSSPSRFVVSTIER